MKYAVEVQILPSEGLAAVKTRTVEVEAPNLQGAVVAAILKLDDEGITHVVVNNPAKDVRQVS